MNGVKDLSLLTEEGGVGKLWAGDANISRRNAFNSPVFVSP